MEIKVQVFGAVYKLCVGYKTQWFCQLSYFSIIREWYDKNKQVEFASLIWRS